MTESKVEEASSAPAAKKEVQLSEVEQKIFEALEKKLPEDLQKVLEENPKQDVNFVDDHHMTPVQHAAYKGSDEMVKMLLKRGADVNKCEHEFDYTALHFGALSGNVDVCYSLLDAGAVTTVINSVGRTAAQMAAFVGNHSVVSTVNNYVPKDDILYYTKPQGLQTTPLLPAALLEQFHKLILIFNVHPIRVAIELQHCGLVESASEVKKVLEAMSEREIKRKEVNEVLSFKFYYLAYMIGEIGKVLLTRTEGNNEEKSFVELLSRRLLKTNKDGSLDYLDKFLRECVREFPYRESTLFLQMVTSLASKDSPTAISVVHSAINGQRAFLTDVPKCSSCGEERPAKKCSKCKIIVYCDRECQRLHWFVHKKSCTRLGMGYQSDVSVDPNDVQEEIQSALAGN